jgi:hypothetical protein
MVTKDDGSLDYMTDDELFEEWAATIRDKETALVQVQAEMAHERHVLKFARQRGLRWAR